MSDETDFEPTDEDWAAYFEWSKAIDAQLEQEAAAIEAMKRDAYLRSLVEEEMD